MPLLVPEDSPLRSPPDTCPLKQIVAFDALRYSLDMVGLAYDRLADDLLALSAQGLGSKPPTDAFTSAFLNAWSVIDGSYRLYQVLHRVPGLKRVPQLEVDLRSIAEVGELRHGVQHLDERL
ncbi:MAG: hypothetical protein HY278_04295 [candidate division NC10 bacterium]|nr:hypothetical protein [candidate division NC10 bacterium]